MREDNCTQRWCCNGDCSECDHYTPEFDKEAYDEYYNMLEDRERDEH